MHGVCEVFMHENLADPDLSPSRYRTNAKAVLLVLQLPVWLPGLPPVVDAQHDGEGAGGQHLLVVVVVQAVSCCQGKSVANLGKRLP